MRAGSKKTNKLRFNLFYLTIFHKNICLKIKIKKTKHPLTKK